MKRILSILLLCMLLIPAAQADNVVTALATEVNPEHLASVAVHARVLDFDAAARSMKLELIVPEVFPRDGVESLQVGDGIYTDGAEVRIETIERDETGSVSINGGGYEYEKGKVWLVEDRDGNYRPMNYNNWLWLTLTVLDVPVDDGLIFLDGVDPETGTAQDLPRVHTADEFLRMLEAEADSQGIGFGTDNVYVVFDADGIVKMISRFYVPWQ